MDPHTIKRRLSCILAADAVGYSAHMGRDEVGTVRVLAAHRAVIDGIIAFHEGRIVGTAGDSVLAEFSSVVEAVRCAVEIQEAIKTRNDSLPPAQQMSFRVGINLGDVVVRENDLLGDGINVAARLETLAPRATLTPLAPARPGREIAPFGDPAMAAIGCALCRWRA
mgnify:CR=1 FL=1